MAMKWSGHYTEQKTLIDQVCPDVKKDLKRSSVSQYRILYQLNQSHNETEE